jgi:hypothetical protein
VNKSPNRYQPYRDPEMKKFYASGAWTNTSRLVRSKNPICQFIDEHAGQCTHPSEVTHHLVDPKERWELRLEWPNLVAVCKKHHQGGQRGETQGYRYAPTVGIAPPYGEEPLYRHENVAKKQFISGGPDDATMKRLMADVADVDVEALMRGL